MPVLTVESLRNGTIIAPDKKKTLMTETFYPYGINAAFEQNQKDSAMMI